MHARALLTRLGPAAIVVLGLVSCGSEPSGSTGPSVLLITLDTTRADRLGCYGYEPARTPHIDDLARRGVRFARAYSPVPLTLPSHATLLTGVHPRGTGLHVNFQGALASEVTTLGEVFFLHGYRTGAFLAAWVLNRDFGLGRGFEVYDDLSDRETRVDQQAERPGDEVADRALAWLDERPDAAFFAWVHFFDPHDPYEPPGSYGEGLPHPYDGEIAFVDAQVGRLLDWLEANERADDTIVIVAGDHGEMLNEHDERTHGLLLYEGAVRVPLIIAGPGILAPGHVVHEPVGLVDVHPTLVDVLGWEAAPTIEGVSLAPALAGDEPAARPVVIETEYPLRSFGWAPLHALVSGPWKYIAAPSPELFDVEQDAGETEDSVGLAPDRASEMRAALERFLSASVVREAGAVDLGTTDDASLAALGYVSGASDLSAFEGLEDLKDPKSMTQVVRGVMRGKTLLDAERYADVVELLAPLLVQSPESDEIWSMYGTCLLQLGRFAEAEPALRNALRVVPDDPARLVSLADALRGLNRPDDALAVIDQALAADSEHGQAHSRMGLLLGQRGDIAGSLKHFARFAELSPDSPNAHFNHANALFANGRLADGLRELRTALRIDPACVPAHEARVSVLRSEGRRREAVEALREAVAQVPDKPGFALQLAWLLATTRDESVAAPDEALLLIDRHAKKLGSAVAFDVLAAARASSGDLPGAITAAGVALGLAENEGDAELAGAIRARLEGYRRGQVYFE